MVLGITALVTTFCCSIFAVPMAIGALATGIVGLVQLHGAGAGKGQAIAGICCGAASILSLVGLLALQIGNSPFFGPL